MSNHPLLRLLVLDALNRAISYYGLEGSAEAIERAYKNMPKIKNILLKELNSRLKKNNFNK